MKFRILGLGMVLAASLMLTACGEKAPDSGVQPSTDDGFGTGVGSGNPVGNPGPGANPNPGAPSNSGLAMQVKSAYDQYLPNCYNNSRGQFWIDWLGRGGSMADLVSTLQIVSTATRCTTDGREITTDPHYIRGYFDYYLPGCFTTEKENVWKNFFANGGTDAQFQQTLANVAVSSPRPACLIR